MLADTGATSGILGLNNFWNTDSAGGAGTFSLATSSINDLHCFAGTGATAGTVSVYGAVSANGITFEEDVATRLADGAIGDTGAALREPLSAGAAARFISVEAKSVLELTPDSQTPVERMASDKGVRFWNLADAQPRRRVRR